MTSSSFFCIVSIWLRIAAVMTAPVFHILQHKTQPQGMIVAVATKVIHSRKGSSKQVPVEATALLDKSIMGISSRAESALTASNVAAEHETNDVDDNINSSGRWSDGSYYNWRTYYPRAGGLLSFLRWLRSGFGGDKAQETDDAIRNNLHKLATMLKLLREYFSVYGMPEQGGPKDQEYVLREVLKDLYEGGVPIWTLEPAMERVAEGLTGKRGVDFCIFPRKAFIFAPSSGAISMFRIASEFDIQKLTGTERILVRIASFASNTHGVSSLPSRFPDPAELKQAARQSELNVSDYLVDPNRETIAAHILGLASRAEGLFFFINSTDRPDTTVSESCDTAGSDDVNDFWQVEDHISELFSRLATIEAIQTMDDMDNNKKDLYSKSLKMLFRFVASAGACAFWFHGGWIDSVVAGCCGSLVGLISTWSVLSKEERVVFEAFASLLVGLIAGVVSLLFPAQTCFGAIGVAGVLDILQGFRVVYAVLELMGKHSVCGSADFLEGLLYTGLIAYCLKVGQLGAVRITNKETSENLTCNNSIDELWYLLLVPAAALSWSGLFNPDYDDLPWMTFHGVLAYAIIWACSRGTIPESVSLFLAALSVTFSSGLVSRFTGRQALGSTVAGLYVLVPGAFLVESLFTELTFNFMGPVILNAAIIGTGAWAGTILCSPTLLGTTTALLKKRTGSTGPSVRRDRSVRENGTGPMLFF